MGDPEGGPLPSGLIPSKAVAYADSFARSRSVDNARWNKAEQYTEELITRIRGTRSSEERRKDVADYVRNIIRRCFECQVDTFGSVPLKTYLPDGDIDLTIVSRDPRLKETWAETVESALNKNKEGKFRIAGVHIINAEVKLIKCHVENIVVDISFNQFGGLCTLCFLEEVDRVIGKGHFFKRSIILVKAWCYYDSRILGAHHGCISTYALETLVLYIFHVFHASLRGPLEVLLRFLQFFSKFDWQKYAVSVWGPVPLASLPERIAELPRKDGGELLLSKDFLDACLEEYAVFLTNPDSTQGRTFTPKHLNVVDPLRPGNNLGRSVNQTNFYRITHALGHSAEKLLTILLDSSKDINESFKKNGFFRNTKSRLNSFEEKRPDAANGIVPPAPTRYEGIHHQINQNGLVSRNIGENGDAGHSEVAKISSVGPQLKNKQEGWTSELHLRHLSKEGSHGKALHLTATSNGGTKVGHLGRGPSHDSMSDNGVLLTDGTTSNSSFVPVSGHIPGYTGGKGSVSTSEAVTNPLGQITKSSLNSLGGITEETGKASKRHGDARGQGDARGSVGNSSQSSNGRDLVSSVEDSAFRASAANRNSYTQTNFENNGALVSNSESPSSVSSRGSVNFYTEGFYDGPESAKRSSPNFSIEIEGPPRSSWVAEQPSCIVTNVLSDVLEYAQQGGQNFVNRGSIPLPVSVIHHAQIPVTLSHPGQLPVHLTTSMALSQTMTLTGPPPPFGLHPLNTSSIINESPLGITSRVGPYYTLQLPRGPPAPPLPPGYYHGPPPLVHQFSTMTEFPNAGGRMSISFPVQQGDDQSFEQQQVWQQMEQMQLQGHGYLRPVPIIPTAVSPLSLNSENSLRISSAPAVVLSGPFHIPSSLQAPQSQTAQSPVGNSRIMYSGSTTNLESLGNSATGYDIREVVHPEESRTSLPDDWEVGNWTMAEGKLSPLVAPEPIVRAMKNSKGKEKKTQIKVRSVGNEDASDVGISEVGMPSSGPRSSGHQHTQGPADDALQMRQGHPHILPATGHALGPSVYPLVVSSPLLYGAGLIASELPPYPPPTVPPPKTAVGHISLSSQSPIQTLPLPVSIPNSLSNSSWPPVAEIMNGGSSLATKQRQRPPDSPPVPPSIYYPPGNPYSLLSMYNTAPVSRVYVVPPAPEQAYIGLDLFSGMHLSRPFDGYSDPSTGQGDDLWLRFAQQGRPGVGERLRAAGVATSSTPGLEATATDTQAADLVGPSLLGGDLLTSDFANHLRNLDYARWCQNSRIHQRMYGQPQYLAPCPTPKYYSEYRPWEGPGRPLNPNASVYTHMMNYGGLVQGPPSMSTPMRMVGSFPCSFAGPITYSTDELPKSHGGTGTYLPSPRPPYIRDRQSTGNGRNQHGGYSQERSERIDRDTNIAHGPRLRGTGRGQSKYELRPQSNNSGVERSTVELKVGERSRDKDIHRQYENQRRNPTQSGPGIAFASPSVGVSHVAMMSNIPPAGLPVEMCSVPIMARNGASSTSGTVVATAPSIKDTNLLEFGSLGEVQVGTSQAGIEMDHGGGHSLSSLEHQNVHTSAGLAGFPLASGDGIAQGPASPQQRVVQGAYQLKDEDFPPLSFRGQH